VEQEFNFHAHEEFARAQVGENGWDGNYSNTDGVEFNGAKFAFLWILSHLCKISLGRDLRGQWKICCPRRLKGLVNQELGIGADDVDLVEHGNRLSVDELVCGQDRSVDQAKWHWFACRLCARARLRLCSGTLQVGVVLSLDTFPIRLVLRFSALILCFSAFIFCSSALVLCFSVLEFPVALAFSEFFEELPRVCGVFGGDFQVGIASSELFKERL
jgi:hypothetical protein